MEVLRSYALPAGEEAWDTLPGIIPDQTADFPSAPPGPPAAEITSADKQAPDHHEQNSDPGAFFDEFLCHHEALSRFAQSLDPQNAEDIVQSTFEKAFTRRDSLYTRPGYNMRNWLYAIARNTFFDQQRQDKRQTVISDSEHPDVYDRSDIEDFDAQLIEQGLGGLLLQALNSRGQAPGKTSTDFAHLAGHLYDGMSITDYAEAFGVKPATVRTRLHRIKAHLTACGFLEQLHRDGWLDRHE